MKTICIDLNGVLDLYNGWKGEDHVDPPRPGAREFLAELQDFKVVVHTSRDTFRVWQWLDEHDLLNYVDEVNNEKVPAFCYVDDRAVCFRGDFHETLETIRGFKAHWEP